jgi:nucleoside-diphosphate-sugar epimerase
MKILVTGANGFVGSALCAELRRRQYNVRAAVRAAKPAQQQFETIAVGEIDGTTDWHAALDGIDTVIHLAARAHVMHETAVDPLAEYLRVNLHGTENLAQQAVLTDVKRLVYASSIKVNGEQTFPGHPYSEASTPAPQDAYGVSKWQAEQALQRIGQEGHMQVVIVRPPLVYGVGVKGNFIRLVQAIDQGLPLPLAGADNQRSLIYLDNLVDALITCATHPAAAGQTFLLSDGTDVSTAQLIRKIAHALGKHNRAFYFPPALLRMAAILLGRKDQADRLFGWLQVNDSKIRSELGWMPPYTLEQGLQATAEWYATQYNQRHS